MKLKNILIVVNDIELAKKFYHEKIWCEFVDKDIVHKNNSIELYFEEKDIEAFVEKLEKLYPKVEYVNHLMTYSWGQKVVRFYDLDGNLIEVRTPM